MSPPPDISCLHRLIRVDNDFDNQGEERGEHPQNTHMALVTQFDTPASIRDLPAGSEQRRLPFRSKPVEHRFPLIPWKTHPPNRRINQRQADQRRNRDHQVLRDLSPDFEMDPAGAVSVQESKMRRSAGA